MIFKLSAKRSQFRLASILHRGLLPLDIIQIPEEGKCGFEEESTGLVHPSDIVSSSVTYKNTVYAKNMLVVLEVVNQDRIVAGWIKKVIVRGKKVFFLLNTKTCHRTSMRYFQSTQAPGELQMKSVDCLKSYKPLLPRGNEAFFVFFLVGKLVDDFAH
jgi:hypothetical protein